LDIWHGLDCFVNTADILEAVIFSSNIYTSLRSKDQITRWRHAHRHQYYYCIVSFVADKFGRNE